MDIKLRFLGAARNVTGSRHLLDANGAKVLVDCGYYQERDFRHRNWDPFPVPPETIDAVLLTHAHLDHCGLLPKLVREGFQGKIFCTAATAEIAKIIFLDSAKIQEEDAKFKKRRHKREGRKGTHPYAPLYTTEDAKACLPLLTPVEYGSDTSVAEGIEASFHDAGHILGASMIKVAVSNKRDRRTVLFSGDVGRWDKPIVNDPTVFNEADYVLVESTYGDGLHDDAKDISDVLARAIYATHKAGGNIIIPSFSLERCQEVLYHLNELLMENRIPHLKVFVDSPMAVSVTEVFEKHPEMFDEKMTELIRGKNSPFRFPGLKMVRSVDDSKAINHIKGTAIIIAGSGMCTGGRVKHHLVNNISRPGTSVLFVGYQARGTLGRSIVDGAKEVRILGRKYKVKSRIIQVHGFSGHADRDELTRWLSGLKKAPRKVFVVHGEEEAAESFARHVSETKGWEVSVPEYQDEVVLK